MLQAWPYGLPSWTKISASGLPLQKLVAQWQVHHDDLIASISLLLLPVYQLPHQLAVKNIFNALMYLKLSLQNTIFNNKKNLKKKTDQQMGEINDQLSDSFNTKVFTSPIKINLNLPLIAT